MERIRQASILPDAFNREIRVMDIDSKTFASRLDRIESLLTVLAIGQQERQWYSVEEFARLVGRTAFTCRQWCRLGRIHAQKKDSGRGAHRAWAIPHAELLRFQREGLRKPSLD
ncbi:hypothetical protein [Planctomicrobium sp. SH527]|uniref:hypothetical protein n=1 Tax=Planctomicrobium sp. SH527 TaxID=3448123 RepID=UPI003F5CA43A